MGPWEEAQAEEAAVPQQPVFGSTDYLYDLPPREGAEQEQEEEGEPQGPRTTLEIVCPEGVAPGEMLTIAADEVRPQRRPVLRSPVWI